MSVPELEVTTETTVIVKMSGDRAGKTFRSIQRAMTQLDKLDPAVYTQLVNTHTIDDLLALATALRNALEY